MNNAIRSDYNNDLDGFFNIVIELFSSMIIIYEEDEKEK